MIEGRQERILSSSSSKFAVPATIPNGDLRVVAANSLVIVLHRVPTVSIIVHRVYFYTNYSLFFFRSFYRLEFWCDQTNTSTSFTFKRAKTISIMAILFWLIIYSYCLQSSSNNVMLRKIPVLLYGFSSLFTSALVIYLLWYAREHLE